eukprot:UN01086
MSIFENTGLVEELKIPRKTLWSFLCSIASNYRTNPFHNWAHGFHVLQFAYYTIMETEVKTYLRKIEVFCMLIACMCHDVDHPGNTNDFEILTQTDRAFTYNDVSVLEKSSHIYNI